MREKLLGKPLATSAIVMEKLTNLQGLAIFGSDALSSTAYATEEILLVLVAGMASLSIVSVYIALAIAALIFVVAFSYRQVIYEYPQGGGVYNVAIKNLGEYPALIGAASLLIDYVLTAAVSTTAGIAAITSAFPEIYPHRVALGIVVIIFLTWANLRGVRESGKLFALPTYFFLASFFIMIGYGAWKFLNGTFPVSHVTAIPMEPIGALGIVLILHAFASGCAAMTGIEATSNGVGAFQAPESKNAAKTLMWMATVLGIIFLGISSLAFWAKVVPIANETIISQIARLLFDHNIIYYFIQFSTALILLLAANTPFAGFPRVASQLAHDGYFPTQFLNLGSRLVFANGIFLLSLFASLLIFLSQGSVHALIPLYAVGVFLGFSISQFGMIIHWFKKGYGQLKKILINGAGFISTIIVFFIVLYSKFLIGAWILIPAVVLIVFIMKGIKKHYTRTANILSLENNMLPEIMPEKTMIILVQAMDMGALYALKMARSFQPARILALHIATDRAEGEDLKQQWRKYAPDIEIDVLFSEYRDLVNPIINFLKSTDKRWANDRLTLIVPQVALTRWWHYFLHNQTMRRLQLAIDGDPDLNPDIFEVTVKTIIPKSAIR
ncbi:MAG: APC family permease [Patescibacteria group bacterium]|nr:APC family permease [Patescibacteria group bacterium]